ncbi:MAG: hypothetical protein ABI333_07635 [bacterium]
MAPVAPTNFSSAELRQLNSVSEFAEELTGDYFQLSGFGPRRYLYDVATAPELAPEEVAAGAFAQLCRYVASTPTPGERQRPARYYRICLQDDNILGAVRRGNGFDLQALFFYIMTHELIHIVRFERFQHPFLTDPIGRDAEEQRVHTITHDILSTLDDDRMSALLAYYRTHRIPRCL